MATSGVMTAQPELDGIYQAVVRLQDDSVSLDPEKAAVYFLDIRADFECLKRCLSALAGTIILYHTKAKHMEGMGMLPMMVNSLEESLDRLRALQVPHGLETHHRTLSGLVNEMLALCRMFPVDRYLFSLRSDSISSLLERIQTVYQTLKKTTCMPIGLAMVALDSGCVCGLHGKSQA
jgi:hypothetical protein